MPTHDSDCPFCVIVQREDLDVREVYRDEHAVAFFPTEPASLGHTLVVPREHIPDVWTLTEDLAAELARVVLRLSAAVKRAVSPDGLNIIQSNGQAATQTVLHFHVHLVPRWEGDAFGRLWPVHTYYREDQKNEAWERLRAECRAMTSRG